jgi:hypothetical protein
MTIAASENWITNPPSGTFQFASFTVNAGQTLTVPSGLTIRVAGDATIAGRIAVAPNPYSNTAIVHPGACSTTAPTNASSFVVGSGGVAVNAGVAQLLVNPDFSGGGNGAGIAGVFGAGGGVLRILASGPITMTETGSIAADGVNGENASIGSNSGGGGAGGLIILASHTSIINRGTISANGGAGGSGLVTPAARAASGGGGGGIIHLLSPSNTAGILTVTGGAGGTNGGGGFANAGGGGACGGNGGATGPLTGEAGSTGRTLITTIANPATLIR